MTKGRKKPIPLSQPGATDPTATLEAAVIEWRDARQAMLDGRALRPPLKWEPLWQRLSVATDALMAEARLLVEDPG